MAQTLSHYIPAAQTTLQASVQIVPFLSLLLWLKYLIFDLALVEAQFLFIV